ncbi:hypothetical protein FWH09_01755 [Candidatus Saccharibacteria bacterium]|nr:hypothetical protein [Candidatus Saccharibacteria bacterium]
MSIKKIVSGVVVSGILVASLFGGNVVLPIGDWQVQDVYANEGENGGNTRGIELSPASLKLNLDPGEVYRGRFTITNRGANEHTFNVYASPYQVSGENYTPTFEGAESAPRAQIARWISFERESYTLAVNEAVEVNFTISVPRDAPGGGQYAAIFAAADVQAGTSSTVQSIGRVGMLLYATINGDINEQGEVVTHTISPLIFDRNLSASATVKNLGNTDFAARQTLVVRSVFGGRQVFSQTRAFEILPDTTRLINMEWDGTPALGLFNVTQVIDASYNSRADENLGNWTRMVLVIPLFLFIIIMIILVILVMMIVLKIMQAISRRRAAK